MEIVTKPCEKNTKTKALKAQQPPNSSQLDNPHFFALHLPKKHKIIQKKSKTPKESSLVCFSNIILNPNSDMKLFTDLQISRDGTVRLISALSNVTLGYYPTPSENVQIFKYPAVVNVKLAPISVSNKLSTVEAINFFKQIPNSLSTIQLLEEMELQATILRSEINNLKTTPFDIHNKDIQFQLFTQYCFNYLIQLEKNQIPSVSSNPCSSAYSYGIGRINLFQKDIEISNGGYSLGFLELIGVDPQAIVNLSLRHKQIDLIINKQDINKQSIYGFLQRSNHIDEIEFISDIVTFDGFPIRLKQLTRNVALPNEFKNIINGYNEFIFIITETDIEIQYLQGLIEYRQKLLNTSSKLSRETFIQRELSFRFEDVEYSVHSELFLEKFYENNLKSLREYEEFLKTPCGFKNIVK